MKKKEANFLIILGYYFIVIPILFESSSTALIIIPASATTNNFENGLQFTNADWTWISTPAPEIVTSQYFEGTHSMRAYEDPANFNYGGGAQISCGFVEPAGGTYFQLRMLFDTDFDLNNIDQICFMSVGNKNGASLFLMGNGVGHLFLVLSTDLPYKAQYSYDLTGQLKTNTWYTFAIYVDRNSNGNIQAFLGDAKVIDSPSGDNTAMDSNVANCGWCWGNHAGNIFIDDVQICELGTETGSLQKPIISPSASPTSTPQDVLNLTFGAIIGGSVTLDGIGNEVVLVPSDGAYAINSGTETTITAHPDNGMRLARWRLSGETATNNPYSWTINTDTTVNVTFEPAISPPSLVTIFLILTLEIAGAAMVIWGVLKRKGAKP
jgi:hypothetical protein